MVAVTPATTGMCWVECITAPLPLLLCQAQQQQLLWQQQQHIMQVMPAATVVAMQGGLEQNQQQGKGVRDLQGRLWQ
jgi:hypothetical protein